MHVLANFKINRFVTRNIAMANIAINTNQNIKKR